MKRNESSEDGYKEDAEDLVEIIIMLREGLYKLLLEFLLYSGVGLSEIVKMIKE